MHFLKKVFLCFILFFSTGVRADSFLAGTSDIPLMNGVDISPVEQMDFDTPMGQIITLEGVSKNHTGSEILSFYENVLPQMGWKESEKGVFLRQEDIFNIVILKNKKPAKVRFDISFMSE